MCTLKELQNDKIHQKGKWTWKRSEVQEETMNQETHEICK